MFSKYVELQTRWGDGNRNPSLDDLRNAVKELYKKDDSHPCAFVSDEFGYVIEAYQDGKVWYFNLDYPNRKKEIKVDNLDDVFSIWISFCEEKEGELNSFFKD